MNLCKKCKTEMVKGLVTAPVMGQTDRQRKLQRGECIGPIHGVVTSCLRCPACGYSVTKDQLYVSGGEVVTAKTLHASQEK
jgi:hypothetical protein